PATDHTRRDETTPLAARREFLRRLESALTCNQAGETVYSEKPGCGPGQVQRLVRRTRLSVARATQGPVLRRQIRHRLSERNPLHSEDAVATAPVARNS